MGPSASVLRNFGEVAGSLSLCVFGVSWPFFLMVYASLGVDPAQLGIDLFWVVSRASIVFIGLLAFALALVAWPLLREREWRPWAVTSMAAVALGVDGALITTGNLSVLTFAAWGALAIVVPVLVAAALSWVRRGILFRTACFAASAIALSLGLVLLPFVASKAVVARVHSGQDVRADIGVGLPFFSIEKRRVETAADSLALPYKDRCLFFLGSHDGLTALFDWQSLEGVWVPADSVTLRQDKTC